MQCSVCESKNVEIVIEKSYLREQFGPEISYESKIINCKECGSKIDDTKDEVRLIAIKQSRIEAIKLILAFLIEKYTLTSIERILGIRPFGTMKKWQEDPSIVDDVSFALLIVLRVNPDVIDKLDNVPKKQINKGISFLVANNQKIRKIDLDEKEVSAISIDDTLVVISEKSVRISVDDKKTTFKQNEIFINR